MEKTRLGRTDIMASRSGFGALPIQRVSFSEAASLLKKAFANGINFFDTARSYTDSEEKIGYALSDVRKELFIATKTPSKDKKSLLKDLETSLRLMKTDYIDIYQLHNPPSVPDTQDPEGVYQGLLEARQKGYIRFLGFTNHRLNVAVEAVEKGLFDTVQFPLNSLSSQEDVELVNLCREKDVGFIAMKAMSGGLIARADSAFAFLRQFDNVVPIWGMQREAELDEFLSYEKNPPVLDAAMKKVIERDRLELSGSFCRGCGYCQPCPAEIPIETAARISLLLARAPYKGFLTDDYREKMDRIENCIHCDHCKKHCPYGLDTPELLKRMLSEYRQFYAAHSSR